MQKVAQDSLEKALLDYAGKKGNMVENAGAVVVLSCKDSSILASATYPTYDISTYSENVAQLNQAAGSPLWNRALLSTYATGSTMKPSVAIAALEEGFITPRMAELLRRDELAAFFAGPLYTELCSARWTLRERRFHLHFPAARFTQDAELAEALGDQQILVQGVIDLCYESADGRLVLCDYKTDRLPHDRAEAHQILARRHGGQLSYYAEACRVLFGREPDRICLWSLALGEAVELK
jgi:hypothetical protein